MNSRQRYRLLIVILLLPLLSGCLFRTRKVDRRLSTAALQEATKQELVARINTDAAKIKTLNATVDIAPAVGGARKGKVTEYKDIRGYILVRKPSDIRMIGLVPIVRNRAFDMVSNGQTFKMSIPVKNRFIIGRNDIIYPSKHEYENLRPQHIFDALLLREIDPQREIAVLEGTTEVVRDPNSKKLVDQPNYTLIVLRRDERGDWELSRKILFSRENLALSRQVVYDKNGNIATEAVYDDFGVFDGVSFPQIIRIWRPQEEYEVVLTIQKLRLNEQVKDSQFNLPQPEGAQVVRMDRPQHPPEMPEKSEIDKKKSENSGSPVPTLQAKP
jgi:outer membrane lipoprotein-sorting protein